MGLVDLLLELEHQHGLLALLTLGQVLVKSRDLLAVLQTAVLEVGVVVIPDAHPVDVGVVVDKHDEVGCDVYIELAAPQSVLLSQFKRFDGVLGIAGLLAFPESSVRGHSDLLWGARSGERYQGSSRGNFSNLSHIH